MNIITDELKNITPCQVCEFFVDTYTRAKRAPLDTIFCSKTKQKL